MIKEFIGVGNTIQEAIINARAGLNAPLGADIEVEVVSEPKKKILGLFGGSDAKVRAYYDDGKKEKKPAKKQAQPKSDKAPAKNKKQIDKKPATKPVKKEKSAELSDSDIDLDYVCSYIKTIVDSFKVEDAVVTAEVVDGTVEVEIKCDDYGIIIGRRGETLDAIQYLSSLAVKKATDKYTRVTINVGNYRAKREETLRALAIKNANYVVRTGKRYGFEPMNPYERRIIHTSVQDVEGATSRSVGNGTDRRVIIEPVGGVKHSGGRGGRRNSRPANPSPAVDPNREKRVDRADIPKFGKIEVNK